MTTPTRARKSTAPDSACVEAVDLARAAAEESAPGEVGEHLGVIAEDERVVTHRFATTHVGYAGWHWAVTLVRAARAKEVTVAELVLLPGDGAVLAPPWVPWVERFRASDLGPGDILPPPENDDRLLPGYTGASDGPYDPADGGIADGVADLVADELGLGRARVMSPVGRADAIDRWYSGDRGPEAPIAAAAPAQCSTCGFLLPMAGSIGRIFGACANEQAPDDGRVVSFDHGCGAHSEVVFVPAALAERPPLLLDNLDYDLLERGTYPVAAPADPAAELDVAEDEVAEDEVAEDEVVEIEDLQGVDEAEAVELEDVELVDGELVDVQAEDVELVDVQAEDVQIEDVQIEDAAPGILGEPLEITAEADTVAIEALAAEAVDELAEENLREV